MSLVSISLFQANLFIINITNEAKNQGKFEVYIIPESLLRSVRRSDVRGGIMRQNVS